jgi:hypothetical protein
MILLENWGDEDIIGYLKNVKCPYFDKISEVRTNEE